MARPLLYSILITTIFYAGVSISTAADLSVNSDFAPMKHSKDPHEHDKNHHHVGLTDLLNRLDSIVQAYKLKLKHDEELLANTKLKRADGEEAHIHSTELMNTGKEIFEELLKFEKAVMELLASHKLKLDSRNLQKGTKIAHHEIFVAQIEHIKEFLKTMHEQLENSMTAAQHMTEDTYDKHDDIEGFLNALMEYSVLAIRDIDAVVLYHKQYRDLEKFQSEAEATIKELSTAIQFNEVMNRLYNQSGHVIFFEQVFDKSRNHLEELQSLIVHAKCKVNGRSIAVISDLTDENFESCTNKLLRDIAAQPSIGQYDHCTNLGGDEITHNHIQKCLDQVSHHEGEHHEALDVAIETLKARKQQIGKIAA